MKKLEELPTLAEIKDGLPELSPQTDLIDSLEAEARGESPPLLDEAPSAFIEIAAAVSDDGDLQVDADADLLGDDLTADLDDDSDDDFDAGADSEADAADSDAKASDESDDSLESESADVIPLRATSKGSEPASKRLRFQARIKR